VGEDGNRYVDSARDNLSGNGDAIKKYFFSIAGGTAFFYGSTAFPPHGEVPEKADEIIILI
jgi:hypothetical protein